MSENIGNNKATNAGHANLIPASPGEVRNPSGRPKGSRNRSTIVREILDLMHESGQTYEYVSTKAVAEKAAAGDVTAWDKLMDSAHGKLSDKIDLDHKSSDKSMSPATSRLADILGKLGKKPDAE
jgi:hypothetical protein